MRGWGPQAILWPDSCGHPHLWVFPVSTPSQGLVPAILPAEARGRFSIKVPWLLIAGVMGGGDAKPFNRFRGSCSPDCPNHTHLAPDHSPSILNPEAPGPYPRASLPLPPPSRLLRVTPVLRGPLPTLERPPQVAHLLIPHPEPPTPLTASWWRDLWTVFQRLSPLADRQTDA